MELQSVDATQLIDLRKKYTDLYRSYAKKAAVVDAPDLLFEMIDGRMGKGQSHGTPPGFQEGMMALY